MTIIYQSKTKRMQEATMLKESVISAVSKLKSLRKQYDNPQSRAFFEKVKSITNYEISGLDEALKILQSSFPELLTNVDKAYLAKVKEYSIDVYKLFLRECVLQEQNIDKEIKYKDKENIDVIIASPSAIMFKKEAFILSVNFMYSGIAMNDDGELYKAFHAFKEKVESMHTFDRWGIFSFFIFLFSAITEPILPKTTEKGQLLRDVVIIGSLLFTFISFTLQMIIGMFHKWRVKKIKKDINLL